MILKEKNKKLVDSISDYKFFEFSTPKKGVFEYNLDDLSGKKDIKIPEAKIRKERRNAAKKNFSISEIVSDFRGIKKQEEQDQAEFIQKRVNKKIEEVKSVAEEEGLKLGQEKSYQEYSEKLQKEIDEKLEILNQNIDEVLNYKENVIREEKSKIYDLINTLCRWVVLKELKEDGEYIKRLLDKVLRDLEENGKVLVKVSRSRFAEMPELFDRIEEKFKDKHKIRVEVDDDLTDHGIILESESNLIDASLETQLETISKIIAEANEDG